MKFPNQILPFLIIALFSINQAIAHGDLSKRIHNKTIEIKQNPNNSVLYLDRGTLFHQHEEYDKAIKDFLQAQSLGNESAVINYRLASSYYELKDFNKGIKAISDYLALEEKDVKGIKVKGKLHALNKDYNNTKLCYDYLMDNMVDIRPEDYTFFSDFTVEETSDYSVALNIVEKGLLKLGENSLALQVKKLDYLIAVNEPLAVVKQFDYFLGTVNRKEFWYYKKANYLASVNQNELAQENINLSRNAISILKPRFKNLKAIKELEINLAELEKRIDDEK